MNAQLNENAPSWEVKMKHQYRILAVTAIVTFGSLVAVLVAALIGSLSNLMIAVFLCGSIGAVVNNYNRLSKVSKAPEQLNKKLNQATITIQMWVSPLLAGILGFVMYSLFLSGLLQGDLFPKFLKLGDGFSNLTELLNNIKPATNNDAVKALFWAFAAGFSERFVPNVLDGLVKQAEDMTKGRG